MANKRKSESAKKDPAAVTAEGSQRSKRRASPKSTAAADEKPKSPVIIDDGSDEESVTRFLGEPVADEEARKRWPHRYHKNQSTVRSFSLYRICC